MQTCLHAVFCEAEYAVDKACFENTFSKIRLINGTSVNSYELLKIYIYALLKT